MRRSVLLSLFCALGACNGPGTAAPSPSATQAPASSAATSASVASSAPPAPSASAAPSAAAPLPAWTHGYPWLTAAAPADVLSARIATEPGFTRVALADEASFAAFLRSLPLEPRSTPVRSFHGDVILAADDPRLAAVVAIDVGDKDLQQCADSVIRMHAEWRWAAGHKDVVYKSLSNFPMPYDRWRRGDRFVLSGKDLAWTTGARPDDSHAGFRAYLDGVFMWANTIALARDAKKVARSELRAGDFFVLGGSPGHAILVLDVAKDAAGHTHALFGQGYMPAQSFHVVRVGASPWVSLDGDDVRTPFWAPFPWDSLRRLE